MLWFCNVSRACNIAGSECGGNNPGAELLDGVPAHDLGVGIQLVIASSRVVVRVLNVSTAEDKVIESGARISRLIRGWKILFDRQRDRI